MRSLFSVAGMLKRDCKIQDWKHDIITPDADDDNAGCTYIRFAPKIEAEYKEKRRKILDAAGRTPA